MYIFQSASRTITATPRQLESLIRLSEALAKMELKDEVRGGRMSGWAARSGYPISLWPSAPAAEIGCLADRDTGVAVSRCGITLAGADCDGKMPGYLMGF